MVIAYWHLLKHAARTQSEDYVLIKNRPGRFFWPVKYSMPTFITPPGCSGNAELTASTGLEVVESGHWRFSQAGYNDSSTFGLSINAPSSTQQYDYGADSRGGELIGAGPLTTPTLSGGLLHLRAQDWTIAGIGNELTDYEDPVTHEIYPASRCRIQVVGAWQVNRSVNSNSYNSIGIFYTAKTETDLGERPMNPWLLDYTSPQAGYVIQGADVEGGAQNTFSEHVFECRITESAASNNSNREFASNTIVRPVWTYIYSKSWQIN